MAPSETLRPYTDRLARLLADARGAEVLAELQALSARVHDQDEVSAPGADHDLVGGIWRVERTAGGVALHRKEVDGYAACHWADVGYVPPPAAGARRVVVIGESVARGCAYAPLFTPTGALARQLEQIAPGAYQCVDLAKIGATVTTLTRVAAQLPLVEPDVVVAIAGNNMAQTTVTGDDGVIDADAPTGAIAGSLRTDGYAAMRRTYIERAVLPRAQRFLDTLLALHTARGTQIVIVVPEFNLLGWAPPAEVEVPVLSPGALARWYELRTRAEAAAEAADWEQVRVAAGQMAGLDGGTSPLPGQLLAQAGIACGDGAAARAGLEASRDALAGLGLPWCTPRIITEISDLLTSFAAEHGFPCVDLRAVMAGGNELGLPDPWLFHDYVHLTDTGMELMMSAVTDVIAGQAPGTTAPGPGIAPELRSFMHMNGAAHSSYLGQPVTTVDRHLRAAVGADQRVTDFLAALLEVIEGNDPRWAHSAIELLATVQPAPGGFASILLSRDVPQTLWTLRAALWDVLGKAPSRTGTTIELLGGRWPNPTAGQSYQKSTNQRHPLGFALGQPQTGSLELTYRMPHAPTGTTAQLTLNNQPLAALPATTHWTTTHITLPAPTTHTGMNWLHIHWPIPAISTTQCHTDGATLLDHGQWPDVLPIFGELFNAQITLTRGAT